LDTQLICDRREQSETQREEVSPELQMETLLGVD
jgi:hypothetical protein